MNFQLEPWHILSAFLGLLGVAYAQYKMLIVAVRSTIETRISALEKNESKALDGLLALQNQHYQFQIEVSKNYIHINEYRRSSTYIDKKIDELREKQDEIIRMLLDSSHKKNGKTGDET